MVNPEKGAPLQARARALVDKHGKHPQPRPRKKSPALGAEPAGVGPLPGEAEPDAPATKKKPWWKLW
jgi:hypothetical protein